VTQKTHTLSLASPPTFLSYVTKSAYSIRTTGERMNERHQLNCIVLLLVSLAIQRADALPLQFDTSHVTETYCTNWNRETARVAQVN
jgi:hypothetical protein